MTTATFMHRFNLGKISQEICGLIYSVRDLNVRATEGAMTGEQIKEAFAEMFPTAVLFSTEISAMTSVYSNLRD